MVLPTAPPASLSVSQILTEFGKDSEAVVHVHAVRGGARGRGHGLGRHKLVHQGTAGWF